MNGQWQRHHIFPRALLRSGRYADIAAMLTVVARHRPRLIGSTIMLPAAEHVALRTGLPLHRGPHPAYDDWLAARLAIVAAHRNKDKTPPIVAIAGVHAAVLGLLRSGGWGQRLAGRAPMAGAPGLIDIDRLIDRIGDDLYGPVSREAGQTSR